MLEFLGEIPDSVFISGDDLADSIGLDEGKYQFPTEPWLMFNDHGVVKLMAKKTIMYGVPWNTLETAGAVFGESVIEIRGEWYIVRLLVGSNANPNTGGAYSGFNAIDRLGSEWGRLMNLIQHPRDKMMRYSDADLHIFITLGNGTYSWCQETSGGDSNYRVIRGLYGVDYGNYGTSSNTGEIIGWRPVLEKLV